MANMKIRLQLNVDDDKVQIRAIVGDKVIAAGDFASEDEARQAVHSLKEALGKLGTVTSDPSPVGDRWMNGESAKSVTGS